MVTGKHCSICNIIFVILDLEYVGICNGMSLTEECTLNEFVILLEPAGKNEKFPRYLKNQKNLKSSEKIEIYAVGYLPCQQLEKNNLKNLGRMREILGAYRKKPITRESVLWNFRKSISDWCINCQVPWPLRINNPFWNRFIYKFVRAILKKSTFSKTAVGARSSTEGSIFRL